MVSVPTDRSGGKIELSTSEFKEFRERLRPSLEAGRLKQSSVSDNPNVRRAISFAFAEAQRKAFISGEKSLAGQIKVAGAQPVFDPKTGRLLGSTFKDPDEPFTRARVFKEGRLISETIKGVPQPISQPKQDFLSSIPKGDIESRLKSQVPQALAKPSPSRDSLLQRGGRKVEEFFRQPTQIFLPGVLDRKVSLKEAKEILQEGEGVPSIVKGGAGFVEELIGTRGQAFKFAAPFAVGAGFGFGVKGAGALLTRVSPTAVKVGELGLGTAGVGLGGLFIVEKGGQIIAAPTASERGIIVGATTRELVGFGTGLKVGSKAFTLTGDIIRTRGLTEIPASSVIAPEFFTGQRFPAIKPGQTAGELRSEFFQPIREIGEVRGAPRGFTALPVEPLGEIPKGGSFVFGGFSAPRVSPQFLRVGAGEQRIKLFSFKDFLTGGKPTIARTEFAELGFAPGVTAKTPRPSGRVTRQQLEFFGGGFIERTGKLAADIGEPIAPRGGAFIPFVKTEKEAITPFGTQIRETGRQFFIKFEGRRIPIAELKAIPETPIGQLGTKAGEQTLGDFLSGSSRIKDTSFITPEIGGISFIPSSGRGVSTFETSFIPSRPRRAISRPSPVPPSRPSRDRRVSDLITPFTDLPSRPSGRRRPEPTIPITTFDFILPSRPEREATRKKVRKAKVDIERKKVKKITKKRKKPKVPIRPSFTGIVAGIEEAPEISPTFGVSGFAIRGLRTGLAPPIKKKKSKKK